MLRYIAWGFWMGFLQLNFQQKTYCFGITGKGETFRVYDKAKHLTVEKKSFRHVNFFHI